MMLTHKIIVYVPPAPPPVHVEDMGYSGYPRNPAVGWQRPTPNQHLRTKLGYNDYITRLYFKKGDTVIKTADSYQFPYVKDAHKRIVDIQEIIHLVEWDDATGLPKCLYIKGHDGTCEWVTVGNVFRLSTPREEYVVPL